MRYKELIKKNDCEIAELKNQLETMNVLGLKKLIDTADKILNTVDILIQKDGVLDMFEKRISNIEKALINQEKSN